MPHVKNSIRNKSERFNVIPNNDRILSLGGFVSLIGILANANSIVVIHLLGL